MPDLGIRTHEHIDQDHLGSCEICGEPTRPAPAPAPVPVTPVVPVAVPVDAPAPPSVPAIAVLDDLEVAFKRLQDDVANALGLTIEVRRLFNIEQQLKADIGEQLERFSKVWHPGEEWNRQRQ